MNEDLFNVEEPLEPLPERKSRRSTLILAAAVVLVLICAVVLVAGWYLGDYMVAWLTSILQ